MRVNIISDKILLCSSRKYRLWYKNGNIFSTGNDTAEYVFLGTLANMNIEHVRLSKYRILQRMLRLAPRCGIFVSESIAIISFYGYVIRIEIEENKIEIEHQFRKDMNNPLTFCKLAGIEGFGDGVYYGEYFGNAKEEEVRIYRRTDEGKWAVAYCFPSGTVRHIHNIVGDCQNKCVYVLAGDEDRQSAIWKFMDNFKSYEIIGGGSQQYRACVGYSFKAGFFYATDSPLEKNHIYYMKEFGIKPESVLEIEGPCIYGRKIGEELYALSTSVEPDSRIKGLRYMLSYRKGKGVKSYNSKVYIGNPERGFVEILSAKKDIFPMLLFGFGTFLFPNVTVGELIITGQSLKRYDGKTISINTDEIY